MDILSNLDTLQENQAKLEAELTAANDLLATSATNTAALQAQVENLKAFVADKDIAIANFNALTNEQKATIDALTAELDTLKAEKKSAEDKAIEMVAKLGVAPLKVDAQGSTATSKAEALAEFTRLSKAGKNREAGEFYKAHRELITK